MERIKRMGPPTPTNVRRGEYDLSVLLSARPSQSWRRAFHTPDRWTEPCHPSRVTVKDAALMFTSEEAHVRLWIELIDEWIAAANDACTECAASEARRLVDQENADEIDRSRQLREATERFKDL